MSCDVAVVTRVVHSVSSRYWSFIVSSGSKSRWDDSGLTKMQFVMLCANLTQTGMCEKIAHKVMRKSSEEPIASIKIVCDNSPSIGSELNILIFLPWVYKATRLPLNSKSPCNLLTVRENHSWLEEDGPGSACTRSQVQLGVELFQLSSARLVSKRSW